jgi:uncharacterized protein with ParB-like and HNH nuclease domain
MFRPEQKSLIEVFLSNTSYMIPSYQRLYSWDCIGKNNKNNQVNLMWDDIFDYFQKGDKKNPYFLGSMVLVGKDQDRAYIVVDGQQRLTTLLLLFAAIKCFLAKVETEDPDLQNFVKEAEAIIDGLIFNKKIFGVKTTDKKLKVERNMGFDYDVILEKTVNCGTLTTIPNLSSEQAQTVNRYFNNRNFFEEKLKENFTDKGKFSAELAEKLNNFIDVIQNRITVVRILIEEENEALKIFEILNNRGLPLTNKDLFRNFIISEFANLQSSNPQKYESLKPNEKWYELEENNLLSNDFLSRFVEAKNGSQQGGTAFYDLQEIYRKYEDKPLGLSKIEQFYNEIRAYLESYQLIQQFHLIESKTIANKIAFLLHAGNEKYSIDLLIALFQQLNYKGDVNETIRKFLITYEQYVIYLMLSPQKRFASSPIYQAIKLINANKIEEATKIFQLEENKLSELKDFIKGNIKDNDIAKLLLAKYVWWQDTLEQEDVVTYNFHFDKATLEHILPQKPETNTNWLTDFSETFRDAYTYKLGNMTLLTQSMNSSAKNRDYVQKKTIYAKTRLNITYSLPEKIDENCIIERQNQIADGIIIDLEID